MRQTPPPRPGERRADPGQSRGRVRIRSNSAVGPPCSPPLPLPQRLPLRRRRQRRPLSWSLRASWLGWTDGQKHNLSALLAETPDSEQAHRKARTNASLLVVEALPCQSWEEVGVHSRFLAVRCEGRQLFNRVVVSVRKACLVLCSCVTQGVGRKRVHCQSVVVHTGSPTREANPHAYRSWALASQ